jgi:hypothetical protein
MGRGEETGETGEKFGLLNSNNNNFLTGLTGLPNCTRRHKEWLTTSAMKQGPELACYERQTSLTTVQWIALLHVRTRDGNQP